MFKIEIKNLATKARIGISDKERKKFQLLLVTLQFSYAVKKNDQLNDIQYLKDYSAITKYLKYYIEHSKFKTLEKLVFECSQSLQKKFIFLFNNFINICMYVYFHIITNICSIPFSNLMK